jgi:hypothetical protein
VKRSSRTRRWHRRIILRSFAVDVARQVDFTDEAIDSLEDRVAALEEVAAARWPRRVALRRRLARSLRASAAAHAYAGPGFAARRAEAVGLELTARPRAAR